MRDTFIRAGWRSCVFAMILTTALLSLSLSYRALFEALAGAWPDSATFLAVAMMAGIAVKWLCEHRSELVEA